MATGCVLPQMKRILATILMATSIVQAETPSTMNIHTVMMESTCKLVGENSIGTGFIIGRPSSKKPDTLFFTLITAHHVLAGMQGEKATAVLRKPKSADDWERLDLPLQIRQAGKDLWQKHPDVDLAAMHLALPKEAIRTIVPMSLLLTDDKIKEFEISPGANLLCLGYPFSAEANSVGFPILRSGRIASYPLLPTKKTKTFLFDFTVFRGNSGGPVYLYETNPVYGGGTHIGSIQGIMGVVTSERNISQRVEQLYEHRETVTPLALGEVIHASFILELVNSLPEPAGN